jgi:uncharacterized protein
MKKRLFKWLTVISIVYVVLCLLLFIFQERVILRPEVLPRDHRYFFRFSHEEVDVEMPDNTIMSLVKFKAMDSVPKGIVLYYHGNKRNIDRYVYAVPLFANHGYEVWMMDYPGFGKSTGEFTEERVYEWALKKYELARQQAGPGNILIYGKSLGTAVAAKIAAEHECQILMLESPYYNLPSLLSHYFPIVPADLIVTSKFPNNEFIPRVTEPVIIFQGTDDWIVPYRNANKLNQFLKPDDRFISVGGAGHSDLRKHARYTLAMDSLLANRQ